MGAPKVKPVMLFWESRWIVIGMSVICPAAPPPSAMILKAVSESRTAAGLRYADAGVEDFTGVDQPPVTGSEFAYESPIRPELSAYTAIIFPAESWINFSPPPVPRDRGPTAPSEATTAEASAVTVTVTVVE